MLRPSRRPGRLRPPARIIFSVPLLISALVLTALRAGPSLGDGREAPATRAGLAACRVAEQGKIGMRLRGGETTAKVSPIFGGKGAGKTFPQGGGDAEKDPKDEDKPEVQDPLLTNAGPEDDDDKTQWGGDEADNLPDVKQKSGEEEEDVVWTARAQVFRMSNMSEWKQRAVGPVRLLRHKENKKIRITVRDDKIFKVRANHYILPGTMIVPHKHCETAYVYSSPDFADDITKPSMEIFCYRFLDEETATAFKGNFTEACHQNELLFNKDVGRVREEEKSQNFDDEDEAPAKEEEPHLAAREDDEEEAEGGEGSGKPAPEVDDLASRVGSLSTGGGGA
mmetsp:Transcript_25045/g.48992  ORF Transcript_25045/g.48992 Transcript_25045/m.48992 type:complete len:338 (+) Transcript_25045:48-1061(+)